MFPLKTTNLLYKLTTPLFLNKQQLWAYVSIAFNKVDSERLRLVGPDRLCAEWILKNGGAVKFVEAKAAFLRDYNSLPPENIKLHLKEVDATDSSVMRLGLDHFKSCKHIDKVIFHNCKHLEEDGLGALPYLKNTLKELQVSSCYNINDAGLVVIKELTGLTKLRLFDLPAVKNLNKIITELQSHLPKCTIDTQETKS